MNILKISPFALILVSGLAFAGAGSGTGTEGAGSGTGAEGAGSGTGSSGRTGLGVNTRILGAGSGTGAEGAGSGPGSSGSMRRLKASTIDFTSPAKRFEFNSKKFGLFVA